MPPKLCLNISSLVDSRLQDADDYVDGASQQYNAQSRGGMGATMGSVRMNQDGITVLTSSYNPYSFSSEGMRKQDGQDYKISEEDTRVVKRLGAGASSTVYKALYLRENRFVAVKKISVFERDMRHQMLNDVKALCDAQTVPGLISFCGAYHIQDSGIIAIVLEYMDGGSLADIVQQAGLIPEPIIGKIAGKILCGLNYLHKHKHMVHRDIKPANILMNLEGDPKITDFGISAFMNNTLAVCHTFLGTVTYMSPERINNEQYSFPADIWALGLTLLECATGMYPYDAGVGPLQLMLQVLTEDTPIPESCCFSPEFKDFLRQCMRKEAQDRPTAETLLEHPFIKKYKNDSQVDLREYMKCMSNPQDKLNEVAIVFACNYYVLLSGGPEKMHDLAPLYSESSAMIHDGDSYCGRKAIVDKLQSVGLMHSGFKVQPVVSEVDCQPVGTDGTVLVHVQGELRPTGMTGAAGKPAPFVESFILSQIMPGEYYVANQIFRLMF